MMYGRLKVPPGLVRALEIVSFVECDSCESSRPPPRMSLTILDIERAR